MSFLRPSRAAQKGTSYIERCKSKKANTSTPVPIPERYFRFLNKRTPAQLEHDWVDVPKSNLIEEPGEWRLMCDVSEGVACVETVKDAEWMFGVKNLLKPRPDIRSTQRVDKGWIKVPVTSTAESVESDESFEIVEYAGAVENDKAVENIEDVEVVESVESENVVDVVEVSEHVEAREVGDLIDEMLAELAEADAVAVPVAIKRVEETKLEDLIDEMLAEWKEIAKEREQWEASLCVAKHVVRFAVDDQVFSVHDSEVVYEDVAGAVKEVVEEVVNEKKLVAEKDDTKVGKGVLDADKILAPYQFPAWWLSSFDNQKLARWAKKSEEKRCGL